MAAAVGVEAIGGTIADLLERLMAAVCVGSGFSDSRCLFSFLIVLLLSLIGGNIGVNDFFGEGIGGGIARVSADCSVGVTT